MIHPRPTATYAGMALSLCLFLLPPPATAADPYAYQDRGDRAEGIRNWPVSADDIVLISARAVPAGTAPGGVPERMRLAFILPPDVPPDHVHVTVRELDYRFYYWLDQVRAAWQPGGPNGFGWPTTTVLQWLFGQGLQTDDLGAVVRLAVQDVPAMHERVAPAVLAADATPVTVAEYRFTFRTNLPARLTCTLTPEGAETPAWSRTFKSVGAGRPFTCAIPVADLAAGAYRLRVDGYSLETNAPVVQEVRFRHDPALQ